MNNAFSSIAMMTTPIIGGALIFYFSSQFMLFLLLETVDQKIKKAKMQEKQDLRIKPGESKTQFLDRLDQQVDKALNAAMMETKKMRQSRKRLVFWCLSWFDSKFFKSR